MALRYGLGNLGDILGQKLGIKERGWSERLAGSPTSGTGIAPTSRRAGFTFPSIGQAAPLPQIPTLYGPSTKVLGTQTKVPRGASGSWEEPSGGGTSGGGGGGQTSNVYSNPNISGSFEQAPEEPQIDFDALIAPALQALDEAVTPLQQSYGADIAGIEAQRTEKIGRQKAMTAAEEVKAERQRGFQQQTAEGAVGEQRRGFSEIQQGLQSLYGGTTGTGRFATEIAGSQALRNIGQVRQNLQNAVSTIDEKVGEVRQLGNLAIEDAETQSGALKKRAKAELEQGLQQIRLQRGELQAKKSELAYRAMENYRSTVADINARNSAFKQQIVQQMLATEQRLTEAKNRATQAGDYIVSFGEIPALVNPLNQAGLTVTGGRVTPTSGGGLGLKGITIGTKKEEEEDLF